MATTTLGVKLDDATRERLKKAVIVAKPTPVSIMNKRPLFRSSHPKAAGLLPTSCGHSRTKANVKAPQQ